MATVLQINVIDSFILMLWDPVDVTIVVLYGLSAIDLKKVYQEF